VVEPNRVAVGGIDGEGGAIAGNDAATSGKYLAIEDGAGDTIDEDRIRVTQIDANAGAIGADGNGGVDCGKTISTSPRFLSGLDFKVIGGGFGEGVFAFALEIVVKSI
jgi:hypothetical protein